MTSYPYLPLRPEIHEIRLLYIEPAASDASLGSKEAQQWSLKLIHASLDSQSAPSFAALSYVWGDPSEKPNITVGGHVIAVTQNLHSALARLGHQNFTGCIWIDALCINQCNIDEKNFQVPLMARIYGQAEQVLVWLGPEPDYGALHAVRELGVLFREQVRNVPDDTNARITAFVKTVRDSSITETSPRLPSGFDFEAIWRFFRQRAWWKRVWIIQEVVLARQAVLLCTEDPEVSAPWEDVRECMQLFEWMVLYPSTAPEHRRLYEILGDIYPNVFHLSAALSGYKRSLAESSDGQGQGGMSLIETIMWTSFGAGSGDSIQATDPRDRIYGLLGITRLEDRRKIVVDYSPDMTLNKVLFMVAKVLLRDHGPDVLTYCRETNLSSQGLPSWVPNWTARRIPVIGDITLSCDTQQAYDASNATAWPEWVSRSRISDTVYEEPAILLSGQIIGRVSKVGREFTTPPSATSFLSDCRDWLQELQTMVEQAPECGIRSRDGGTNRHPTKSETIENLWRVPIADVGLLGRPSAQETVAYAYGLRVLTGQQPPPLELNEAAKADWITSQSWDFRRPWKIYERRSFIDADGRPGLGLKNIEPGDSIAIFAGGHVPFVLRQHEEASLGYRLIGSAYIYGLMDGEAMSNRVSFNDIQLV